MKRVGALLGAMAMVVAALALRGSFSSDGDGAPSDSETGGDIVCVTELADACDTLDPTTLSAGALADDLIAANEVTDLDARTWVLPSAWAELVIAERARLNRAALFEIGPDVLASTDVVLLAWEGQDRQLSAACGTLDWSCVAGDPDVDFRVRPGSPVVDTALGLPVAAAQAADLLGTGSFASNDFDPAFETAAQRLAAGQLSDPVGTMRLQGPGRLSVVAAAAASADALQTNFGTIVRQPGEPAVRVDVVVLSAAGGGLDDDQHARVAAILRDEGWSPPGDGDDGLPSGGVLAAIRTLWKS